ncbi:TPA: hypothetical protein VB870_002200 [Streptococcus suis]|nr:hypothetical protein [Streptococcus suis]
MTEIILVLSLSRQIDEGRTEVHRGNLTTKATVELKPSRNDFLNETRRTTEIILVLSLSRQIGETTQTIKE